MQNNGGEGWGGRRKGTQYKQLLTNTKNKQLNIEQHEPQQDRG